MKTFQFALFAASLLTLSACAGITAWTGLTAEDQSCIANAAVLAAQAEGTMAERIATVETACGVTAADTIATAITAALEAA